MSVKPIKLNSMVGAAWGQKGTLPIPNGPTYHELELETNADALLMLERYKRRDPTSGHYIIPFSDVVARTKNGGRYTGLVTELGDNIHLEIQFRNKRSGADPLSI
ncbi:major capsid protein P2 [Vibrio tubiashii]|uniref:major capsid protein P2 n=1 Tax=Vibrio tubiashii TaxID=29498 RepID=UPI001EFEC89B|nr:major capsid protein P2 [Vibrio tubiashii]MCG9578808.1 major capsid protein P2 [Vibrio tubiashii]